MRHRHSILFALALLAGLLAAPAASAQGRDFLTTLEADRIRDAETSSERIKLFVGFAADRIRKFQYEQARPNPDRRRDARLKSLLDQYAGCMDDAAELVDLGLEKSQDVRAGVKELQTKGKEFQEFLEKLLAGPQEVSAYRDNLEDAILSTKDALKVAARAHKEIAPPPVRRKPS